MKDIKHIHSYISKAAALVIIFFGCLTVLGWVFNIPFFKSFFSAFPGMKFNTAICFILAGIILLLLRKPLLSKRNKTIVVVFPFIIIFISGLTLLQYLFNWHPGIYQLLWKNRTALTTTEYPDNMSLIGTLKFIVTGIIFLWIVFNNKFSLVISSLLFFIISVSVVVFFNHIFGVSFLSYFKEFDKTNLYTAILFILLSTGVFFSPSFHLAGNVYITKLTGYSIIAFFFISMVFFANVENKQELDNSRKLVELSHQEILKAQEINSSINDINGHAMKYVLSGDVNFLAEFNNEVDDVLKDMFSLKELKKSYVNEHKQVDTLQRLFEAYLLLQNEIFTIRKNRGIEAALEFSKHNNVESMIDNIQDVMKKGTADEKEFLAGLITNNDYYIKNSTKIILLFQIIAFFLILAAITEVAKNFRLRNRAENELKRNLKFIEALLNAIPVPVFFKDIQGRYTGANKAFCEQVGFSFDEIKGKTASELWPAEQAAAYHKKDLEVMEKKEHLKYESTIFDSNNRLRKAIFTKDLFYNEAGNIAGIVGAYIDITERKMAEEKIQQLSQAVEQSPVSIVITDTTGAIEYVNPKFVELTGYSFAEVIGKNPRVLKSGHTSDDEYRQLWETLSVGKEWHGEFHNRKKSGELFWESASISPILDAEGQLTHYLAVKEDITERKYLDDARKKAVERHSLLTAYAPYCIHEIDLNGNLAFMNNAGLNMLGLKREEEIIGVPYLSMVGSADFNRIQALLNEAKQGIPSMFGFASGDGKYYQSSFVPLPGKDGKVDRIMGISTDLTGIKETEEKLKKYATELEESNSDLEHFAYAASHDLQEPLRMVSSFLNLLEKRLDGQLDETTKQYIHFAVDGATRMKTLIKDLLEYSRVGSNKEGFMLTDLNDTLNYVRRIFIDKIVSRHAVLTIKPMPLITANKTLMGHLFANLVSNALKYHDNKAPEIEVGYTEEPGEYIFYVKDNGIGIDPQFHDKIFVIFKRLHGKKAFSGTGIGLAVCKKITDIHKGRIWVESELGKGSTFFFSISKTL